MATQKIILLGLLIGLTACQTTRPPTVKVIGLWPDDPPLMYQPFNLWSGGDCYIWPVLDSPQPTLRWEPFPRPGDIAVDTGHVLAQITRVSYDLRIWRNVDGFPSELVYARDALPGTAQRIEPPLQTGQAYFWSIRARFTLTDQTRVTEWSRIESPRPLGIPASTNTNTYPDARYYRFSIR